jgi:hypothetical protein
MLLVYILFGVVFCFFPVFSVRPEGQGFAVLFYPSLKAGVSR